MNYIIYFDIAALFNFFISLFLYEQHKNLEIPENFFFLWLNIYGFLATVFDILSTEFLLPEINVSVEICYLVNCAALIFVNSMPTLYCLYINKLTKHQQKTTSRLKRILLRWLIIIPYSVEVLMILISPFSAKSVNIIFAIDENKIYHRGPGMIYIYICMMIYIIHAIIFLVKGKKKIPKRKYRYIWSYFIILFIVVIIQYFFPNLLLINYGTSITGIFLCCFVHTQEDVADGITKLFNRNAFIEYTDFLFSRKQKFTCLNINVNNTDYLVNSFGINHFNNCLKDICSYFTDVIKKADGFYLEKGQFCYIIRDKKSVKIDSAISEIRNRFNRGWLVDSSDYKLDITICIIECPGDSNSPNDIMTDISFIAEEIGYSKNVIYAKNIDTNEKKRLTYIEQSIFRGIEKNRFHVYCQPIYAAKQRRIIGAEITPRLSDSRGRLLYPEEFMDVADKTGTSLAIGNVVLRSLLNTLQKIKLEEYGILKININLSLTQFIQGNLIQQILLIRDKFNISPDLINLEITETATSLKIDRLTSDMETLSREGFELVLDNFGAGLSNFDYLLKLPFKTVKIDKSIIDFAYKDLKANKALKTVITMIHRLGMSVMAEGIKTKEQAEWLIKSGCDYLQGSYYSDPVTEEDFLMIMKKINSNMPVSK